MSQPTEDSDLVDLSFEFQGLQISIRGSPASAASFLRGLSTTSSAASSSFAESAQHSASAGYPLPGEPTAASPTTSTTAQETRDSILASFALCPSYWLVTAATQLGGSRQTAEGRAKRAWVAGKWAQATAAKRVSSPNRSPAINLQNRYWCVLFCRDCHCPAVFTSSAAFFRNVGALQGSDTICHAFPSQVEAKIYFAACGVEFPEPSQ